MIMRDQARRRRKSQRVFSVDTAFDGMAGEADILLLYRQAEASCNANLLVNEIDTRDGFRNRMFHLKDAYSFR